MIQRKQTVFLIIALLFTVACLCMPVGVLSYNKMGGDAVIYNLWVAAETGKMFTVWPLFAILLLSCPLNVFTVFSYHNRKLQSKLCVVNAVLMLVWAVVMAVYSQSLATDATFRVAIAAAFPIVALILYMMAKHGVDADERLVRAADRIR